SHDPGVVVVESCVVRSDDGIMFGSPLQLARVSHTAGHHRIRIDRPVLDLTQRFLLGEQEDVPAGLNGLAVRSDGSGSMEEGGMLQPDEGEPNSETCTE